MGTDGHASRDEGRGRRWDRGLIGEDKTQTRRGRRGGVGSGTGLGESAQEREARERGRHKGEVERDAGVGRRKKGRAGSPGYSTFEVVEIQIGRKGLRATTTLFARRLNGEYLTEKGTGRGAREETVCTIRRVWRSLDSRSGERRGDGGGANKIGVTTTAGASLARPALDEDGRLRVFLLLTCG